MLGLHTCIVTENTQYSVLDGLCKIQETITRAKELGFKSYAITDHGNMFGVIPFYQECKKQGIKPIIGCEFYIAPNGRKDRVERLSNHLILIAKNNTGYKNLIQLSTKSYLEGFYYKPRIDREILSEHADGLVCMSACLQGEIPKAILDNNKDAFNNAVDYYKSTFGDDFYFELQNHGLKDEDIVRDILIKNAQRKKIKLVCTNDVHYLNKDDHKAHDILLCVQTGKKISDENRMKYETHELYLKSYDEMVKLFPQEAIENTLLIDSLCNLEIELGKDLLPKFPCENVNKKLKEEIRIGTNKRFSKITDEIKTRVNYEFEVIKKLGFASYFLIVQDFINYAKSIDVPVGVGRGSVAGSLVAYVLGITEVNPLQYDLLFERFLNPDRVSLPDIDIDFADRGRERIIEYVSNKYGQDSVSQIVTFGTMGGRAVIRDVARTLSIPIGIVDNIAKMVDQKLSIEENCAIQKSLEPLIKSTGINPKHLTALEDLNRHASVHAAGVLISPDKITNHCPLMLGRNGEVASQYDMKATEALGLLKMDFLGLRTLTIIDDCCKAVGINIKNIPTNDKKTYDLIGKGLTVGIFQFESSGMRDYLIKLQPKNINDLAAMAALYRPGPMNLIDSYINRKYGRENVEYLHPKMEPALKDTYAICVYQEQVMQLTKDIAGFTLSEGDVLRKAIGKKNKELLLAQRDKFVKGCIKEGNGEALGNQVFDLIEKFALYGFNKCLSGDTVVFRAGANQYSQDRKISIKDLYNIFNSNSSAGYKYRNQGLCIYGGLGKTAKQVTIKDVIKNGIKKVYKIKLKSGHNIKATDNHNFYVDGQWKQLKELKFGDLLSVTDYNRSINKYNYNMSRHNKDSRPIKGYTGGSEFKKSKDNAMYINGNHILFEEARKLKTQNPICEYCSKANCRLELHHIDKNRKNNNLSNLVLLCVSCHKKEDYKLGRTKRSQNGYAIYKSEIVSIEYIGKEETYDIEIKESSHAFYANGILTHNSHAVGYSILAYQTAYLKANYPAEFMCALLNSEINDLTRISTIIYDCNKMGIDVLPPSINKSDNKFSVEGKKIRFGLQSIRNIGGDFASEIKNNRPYKSMVDVCMKIKSNFYNSRKLESLINAGCFDEFGTRKGHVEIIDIVNQTSRNSDYYSFFEPDIVLGKGEFGLDDLAKREREALGIYFFFNPLSKYNIEATAITDITEDGIYGILCIVDNIKKKTTRGGTMIIMKVIDLYSSMECLAFNMDFIEGEAYLINGKFSNGKFLVKKAILAKEVLK